MKNLKSWPKKIFSILVVGAVLSAGFGLYYKLFNEKKALKEIISRLEADSRIAEVLVTDVSYDEKAKKAFTTIKFLEYGVSGEPLTPKYFTFSGNIIQFQSLVARFDDIYVGKADQLRGKSAYLFWKVFVLDGENTETYDLARIDQIPEGYKIENVKSSFEENLWKRFWEYALNPDLTKKAGIKNVQIEAPGTMFVRGVLYTIKIEHDGGMRIDTSMLPSILKGEKIPE